MPRPRKAPDNVPNTGWIEHAQWAQMQRVNGLTVVIIVNEGPFDVFNAVGVVTMGTDIVEIFDGHAHKVIGKFKTEKAAKEAAEKFLKKYVKEMTPAKYAKGKKCACETVVDAKKVRARLKRANAKPSAPPKTWGTYANGAKYMKVPKKDQCGEKDSRGKPCIRDKNHTPDGKGVGLHVTADGRGFHGAERSHDSHGACTGCGDRLCPGGCS